MRSQFWAVMLFGLFACGPAPALALSGNDSAAGSNMTVQDAHPLLAGFHLPFMHKDAPAAVAADCKTVVNPYTGKKTCVVDSDQDGVPDSDDQCQGTPAGARVDDHGCPLAENVHDADGDGVPDVRDACLGTAAGFKVNAAGCALPQIAVVPGIDFGGGSNVTISDESKPVLDGIAEMLKGQTKMHLEIGVYADAGRRTAAAPDLTKKRASAIADYLAAQGIDPARLSPQGYGAAKPIASNTTEEGRQQNRRVEFKVSVE